MVRPNGFLSTRHVIGLVAALATVGMIVALVWALPTERSGDAAANSGLALETQLTDMRLIASATLEPPDETTSVTVTPSEPVMLDVRTDCEHDGVRIDAPLIELSIDGVVFAVGYCSTGMGGNPNFWHELGVEAGEPVTIDLEITDNPGPVVIGVYEPGVDTG